MKKPLLTTLVFAAILGTACAQKLTVRTYVEKTKMSPKSGTAVGFENNYQWEYGAFYQETSLMESLMMNQEEKKALPRQYEREFYGVYFEAPMWSKESLVVKMNVRTGVSNGQNFVITPSVLADYKLGEHLRVGMGVGTRAFQPTLQASVAIAF